MREMCICICCVCVHPFSHLLFNLYFFLVIIFLCVSCACVSAGRWSLRGEDFSTVAIKLPRACGCALEQRFEYFRSETRKWRHTRKLQFENLHDELTSKSYHGTGNTAKHPAPNVKRGLSTLSLSLYISFKSFLFFSLSINTICFGRHQKCRYRLISLEDINDSCREILRESKWAVYQYISVNTQSQASVIIIFFSFWCLPGLFSKHRGHLHYVFLLGHLSMK